MSKHNTKPSYFSALNILTLIAVLVLHVAVGCLFFNIEFPTWPEHEFENVQDSEAADVIEVTLVELPDEALDTELVSENTSKNITVSSELNGSSGIGGSKSEGNNSNKNSLSNKNNSKSNSNRTVISATQHSHVTAKSKDSNYKDINVKNNDNYVNPDSKNNPNDVQAGDINATNKSDSKGNTGSNDSKSSDTSASNTSSSNTSHNDLNNSNDDGMSHAKTGEVTNTSIGEDNNGGLNGNKPSSNTGSAQNGSPNRISSGPTPTANYSYTPSMWVKSPRLNTPSIIRRQSGHYTVMVQVVIDENGQVTKPQIVGAIKIKSGQLNAQARSKLKNQALSDVLTGKANAFKDRSGRVVKGRVTVPLSYRVN